MAGLAYAPEARMLVPAGDPATAWTVILDPSAVATARTALSINAGAIAISQDGIDWGQAAIDAYEAALQKWGSTVVDFRVPNRMVTINLLVGADNSGESGFYDAAMALRQKVALFQREGGWIQRGHDVPMYADIVSAALTFADQYGETGFLESNVILTLECLPDFYGDEIALDVITCTGYCTAVLQQSGVQAVIEGDHPGRCRIIVTDSSGHNQQSIFWGFRSRHYNSAATAALAFNGADMAAGAGASVVALAGSYSGNVMRQSTIAPTPTEVLSIQVSGAQPSHAGSYRVRTRCYSASGAVSLQLSWIVGALVGASGAGNDPVPVPATGAFYLVDLGTIRLDKPPIGNMSWLGFIFATAPSGGSVAIDKIWLEPLDEAAGAVVDPTIAVVLADDIAELRYDGMFVGESGLYGPMRFVTGDLPRIPPSGLEGRPVELLIKPSRSDLDTIQDSGIDTSTVQVKYRPSYVFRP